MECYRCLVQQGFWRDTALAPWGKTETTPYTFNSCRNGCDPIGCDPIGPATVDAEGNLYGTTFSGGPEHGYGVIF